MVQKKLPTINNAHGADTRNIINELIKTFNGMGYTYDEALQKAHDVLSEAQETNDMNQDVQKQINNLILSDGESDAEVIQARGDHEILKSRFENIESKYFDANDYGADVSANWQKNRDAFQAANDAAYANGGGVVVAKPGVYEVKGIIQDSHVIFDLPGTTFKNPDGLSSVITSRRFETTGNIVKGESKISVESIENIEIGTVLMIHHAGGILDTQFTALSANINATTTSISIENNNGYFPRSGYMQVGEEIIGYSSISGTSLNGVERGSLGTTATSHVAGDYIGVARHLYAEVTDIQGNDLIINESAVIGVTDSTVQFGIVNPSIQGLTIDANKVSGGHSSSVYGLVWSTASRGKVVNFEVQNGDMGGLIFNLGTSECFVDRVRFRDCGVIDTNYPKGAAMWLFAGTKRNRIKNITVTGSAWVSVYIDDRTSIASPSDAPNYDNYISSFVFDTIRPSGYYPPAFSIVGSSRNKFINGFVRGAANGVEVDPGSQYLSADGSRAVTRDNEIAGVHFDVLQPWILRGVGNRLHECTYTDRATSVPVVGEGNLVYAVTTSKGEPINSLMDIKFRNGTAATPAISFLNDTTTGFYRDGSPPLRLSIGGQLKYSFFGTEFRLADGINIATGTGNGTKIPFSSNQKLGFFGKTPISQPSDITNKTGQTLEQVEFELNLVKTALRNLGLIGG